MERGGAYYTYAHVLTALVVPPPPPLTKSILLHLCVCVWLWSWIAALFKTALHHFISLLSSDEFKRLNVSINQICRTQPDKCTCPKPGPLCRSPTTAPVTGGGEFQHSISALNSVFIHNTFVCMYLYADFFNSDIQ